MGPLLRSIQKCARCCVWFWMSYPHRPRKTRKRTSRVHVADEPSDSTVDLGAEIGLQGGTIIETLLRVIERAANSHIKKYSQEVAIMISGPAPLRSSARSAAAGESSLLHIVYAHGVWAMLDNLETSLDNASAIVDQWLLQQSSPVLAGSRLKLNQRVESFSRKVSVKLKRQFAGPAEIKFSEDLKLRVRSLMTKRIMGVSPYAYKTWRELVKVLLTDPIELSQATGELTYMLGELKGLRDASLTDQNWQLYTASWVALLDLRRELVSRRAQHVLDAIILDDDLMQSLAKSNLLKNAKIKSGCVPTPLLNDLNQGPVEHIKMNYYKYQNELEDEIARIKRIGDLQQRAIAQSYLLIASGAFAVASLVSNVAFAFLENNEKFVNFTTSFS